MEQRQIGRQPTNQTPVGTNTQHTGNRGAFDRSMQHHLRYEVVKDGVYDPREKVEAFYS